MLCSALLKESSGESAARMSAVVNVLLMSFLLHNVHCESFSVSLPEKMVALRGSCLTIPCSFTVGDDPKLNLNKCRTEFKGKTSLVQTVVLTRPAAGDLTQNCTTTLHDLTEPNTRRVDFRLECDDPLLSIFRDKQLNIKVTDAPPTPTLTPPTLSVSEGQSVSVQCSAPVPCPSLPPTLTWSPVLGHIQETLQEQQDKTYVKVSTLSFTASDPKTSLSCTAAYSREDGTFVLSDSAQIMVTITNQHRNTRVTVSPSGPVTEHSNVTLTCSSDANPAVQHFHWYKADGGTHTQIGNTSVLNMKASRETTAVFCEAQNEHGTENSTVIELDVQFPPQILSSSNCTGDSLQIICVCETEGNPFPLIQWSFPGVSPNISISSEPLSDKARRSVITVIKPQGTSGKDSVTLVCHSSNSLGYDRKAFEHALETRAFQQSGIGPAVTHPLLITIIVILLVLIGVLLFVVGTQNVHLKKRQSADVASNQILPTNEVRGISLLMWPRTRYYHEMSKRLQSADVALNQIPPSNEAEVQGIYANANEE